MLDECVKAMPAGEPVHALVFDAAAAEEAEEMAAALAARLPVEHSTALRSARWSPPTSGPDAWRWRSVRPARRGDGATRRHADSELEKQRSEQSALTHFQLPATDWEPSYLAASSLR